MFNIPNDVRKLEINKPTLVSWVVNLSDILEAVVPYFYQAKKVFTTRYFWQTPDASFSIAGLGTCKEYVAQDYRDMAISREKLLKNTITNAKHSGTGPVFLGGFPFDKTVDSQKTWQELGDGYLFIPKIMVTQTNDNRFLTFNMIVESSNDLNTQWENIATLWNTVSQNKQSESPTRQQIQANEIHVPEWLETVELAIDEITSDSDIRKIVLARELFIEATEVFSVNDVLKNCLEQQENTYVFVLEHNENAFIGATPERLLLLQENNISTACVAGSIPRGKTVGEDNQLGSQLLNDMKNQVEHQIVVEAIERDMSQITETLSEKGQPSLLKNRDIQHLFYPFSGEKKADISFFSAIEQLHPTPALGGQPKELTTKWIREHEPINRGLYGAPIGWSSVILEEGECAVGIRSALLSGKSATLYAGCGVVADSIPQEELKETRVKFQPMLRAIGGEENVTSK